MLEGDEIMAQIDKNTVSAEGQLKKTHVFLEDATDNKLKILFVGNSITRHGKKADIGWYQEWGMAASSAENDYVHLMMKEIRRRGIDAACGICQVADWERQYQNGSSTFSLYEQARDFDADILIMRCVENCPVADFDANAFEKEYERLMDYLNKSKKANIILTTGFWKHPGDETILSVAKKHGYPGVYLGDLGEMDEMKAIGLFEHSGVAAHPGDLGMKTIADRLLNAVFEAVLFG